MENEITVASFKEAAKGPDGPEKIVQLIVDLVSDRNYWKEGAQELALHQLTVERERDELQALLRAYDLDKASLEGFINDLKAEVAKWTKYAADLTLERNVAQEENAKLREAVVQAPMVPSHVCSRECAHD